ncbi:MAG: membrane-associated protein [Candidatus Omnitrophica bacterium]|nr:membrane-associated protein [Candidatus Omnitrophota bacterium]
MAKIDVKASALAFGVLWAIYLIVIAVAAAIAPNYCDDMVVALGSKYIGYAATVPGALIGAAWGFVDAGVFGLLLALLYNKFLKK